MILLYRLVFLPSLWVHTADCSIESQGISSTRRVPTGVVTAHIARTLFSHAKELFCLSKDERSRSEAQKPKLGQRQQLARPAARKDQRQRCCDVTEDVSALDAITASVIPVCRLQFANSCVNQTSQSSTTMSLLFFHLGFGIRPNTLHRPDLNTQSWHSAFQDPSAFCNWSWEMSSPTKGIEVTIELPHRVLPAKTAH